MTQNETKKEKTKKTKAKRMGVKSVLAYGDGQIAITGFGKGNDARVAIQTDKTGSNLAQKDQERHITAHKIVSQGIHTTGTGIDKDRNIQELKSHLQVPEESRQDYLGLKATLEKEFFDKEFPNDNIRIQIIHNILDIQKLLGIYVNDILYTVNNLRDVQDIHNQSDILGLSGPTNEDNIDDTIGKMRPYLGFFGDAFEIPMTTGEYGQPITLSITKDVREKIEKTKNAEKNATEKIKNIKEELLTETIPFRRENLRLELAEVETEAKEAKAKVRREDYDAYEKLEKAETYNKSVIRLLYACRQCSAHFKGKESIFFLESEKLKGILSKKFNDADWSILKTAYDKRVNEINQTFLDHSKVNLRILFRLFKDVEQEEIIDEYFRFSILKDGKNLGVNMTKLRETMLAENLPGITDDRYATFRSKIYSIVDYILFRTFGHSSELEKMVDDLRQAADEDKDGLYALYAKNAWEQSQTFIEKFYSEFSKTGSYPKWESRKLNTRLEQKLTNLTKSDIPFVQILSYLCNFLEGKEINELLSAYIHKFENIQSFLNTLKELGEKVEFKETYGLFNGDNAKKIAQTLRYIVSIGKMKGDLSDAKRPLFKAAIQTLGIEKLDIENDEEKFNKWLEDNVLASKEEKKKDCNPFRNFIAKQIIENRRFLYLVRYTKPQTVRAVMSNPVVVQYVLSRLGNIRKDTKEREMTQIDKYYKRINGGTETNHDKKIEELTKMLTGLSFDKIVDNKGKIKDAAHRPGKENQDIEKLKGLISLYLTVAYIAVKNLVKANARYYIAFSIFERDYELLQRKVGKKNLEKYLIPFQFVDDKGEIKDAKNKYFAITEHFVDSDNALRYQWNPKLTDEKNKQALRKHIDDKTIRSQRHFTQEWLDIFYGNLEDAEKRNKKPKEGNLKTAKRIHPTGLLLSEARNHAEHLNALTKLSKYIDDFKGDTRNTGKPRNLYFQLYHYLVQRLLFEEKRICVDNKPNPLHEPLQEYAKEVEKHNTPSSDLINITYVSLGYNLPRYKNLTIEGLFEEQQ